MEKKYKYRSDRRCRRITAALLLILAGLFVWFHFVLGGDYLPAWGLFFVVCIITLYILSIPRYILLDDAALEIHCIVDLTRIHIEDIELIRRIERSEFRRLWQLRVLGILRLLFQLPGVDAVQGLCGGAEQPGADRGYLRGYLHRQLRRPGWADRFRFGSPRPETGRDTQAHGRADREMTVPQSR